MCCGHCRDQRFCGTMPAELLNKRSWTLKTGCRLRTVAVAAVPVDSGKNAFVIWSFCTHWEAQLESREKFTIMKYSTYAQPDATIFGPGLQLQPGTRVAHSSSTRANVHKLRAHPATGRMIHLKYFYIHTHMYIVPSLTSYVNTVCLVHSSGTTFVLD